MSGLLRKLCLIVSIALPWAIKRRLLGVLLGYVLDPTARIGLALVDVRHARLGPGAKIGSFTVIRNLELLELGPDTKIGTFNWIFGMISSGEFFAREADTRRSRLVMGKGAAITSRHLIDCIDSVTIGEFTTVAGFRSQILTHSINVHANRQSCAPVRIGSYCFVGTGAILLPGAALPDRCVLAAGSTLTRAFDTEDSIYAGCPAVIKSSIDKSSAYFSRVVPRVS